jgi:hypothetical protein
MTKIKLIKSLLDTFKKIDSVSISNEDTFFVTRYKNRLLLIKAKSDRFKLKADYTLLTQIPTKFVNPKLTRFIESHY